MKIRFYFQSRVEVKIQERSNSFGQISNSSEKGSDGVLEINDSLKKLVMGYNTTKPLKQTLNWIAEIFRKVTKKCGE